MKGIGLVVLSVALAGLGCLPPSFLRDNQKPPAVELKEPPPPPAVQAEGITEQNAAERARQLREELEYDLKRQEQAPESAKKPAKS